MYPLMVNVLPGLAVSVDNDSTMMLDALLTVRVAVLDEPM